MTLNNAIVEPAETVRRGKEIYENTIRPLLGPEHHGQYVIIDTLTNTYEIAPNHSELNRRLVEKDPSAARYIMRIGYRAVYRKGGSALLRAND